MALTFPAAYHNRDVIFFSSIVYIALLWSINFCSSFFSLHIWRLGQERPHVQTDW